MALLRITSTAACLYAASAGVPIGGGPTLIGRPFFDRASANPRTCPHWAPTKVCTFAGRASPFCATVWASASGCQRVGSCMPVPVLATTSGALTGV